MNVNNELNIENLLELITCVDVSLEGGVYKVDCKRGLWGVAGEDAAQVLDEGWLYFVQYKKDGEYSDLIGGPTVEDVLRGKL